MNILDNNYPSWICSKCGLKYGKSRDGVTSYHINICGWCKEKKSVCHARNYRYPEYPPNSDIEYSLIKKKETVYTPLIEEAILLNNEMESRLDEIIKQND